MYRGVLLLLLLLHCSAFALATPPCTAPTLYIRGELVSVSAKDAVAQVHLLGSPIHGTTRPEDIVFETGPSFRVLLVHGVVKAPSKEPKVWLLDRRPKDKALIVCRILPDLPQPVHKNEEKKKKRKKKSGAKLCSRSCRFGAKCVLKASGRRSCECPTFCPARFRPVCGSDGVTYANRCLLKRASCRSRKEIGVLSVGKCDKCSAVRCPFHGVCSLASGAPKCTCPLPTQRCAGSDGKAVCGSDRVTYQDACHMRVTACTQKKEIRVVRQGPCLTGESAANPCKAFSCPHPFHSCRAVQGLPECRCPASCAGEAKGPTVCGSDGAAYRSPCRLRRSSCRAGKDVHMLYQGACSQPKICLDARVPCGPRGVCQRDWTSRVRCLCPTCHGMGKDLLGSRVCASDGNTWPSECHVRAEACAANRDLRILHEGPCDLCKRKQCNFYARCHVDHREKPECVCPTACPKATKPICASNGKTFDNSCLMKVEACRQQKNITEIDQQPCKRCTKDCPVGTFCLHGKCHCREKCPGLSLQVCGGDGKVYRTECDLGRAACLQKKAIEIDPTGERCRKPEVKPLQDQVEKPKEEKKPKKETKAKPSRMSNVATGSGVSFSPTSSVSLPPYEILRRYFTLELHVIPDEMNGNLVFLGPDGAKNAADTLVLSLVNGYVVYSFDLGSGPLILRSEAPLQRRRLHRLIIVRKGRQGKLFVDGKGQAGRSPGRLRGFNIRPSHTFVVGKLAAKNWASFSGCITFASLIGHRPSKRIDLLDQLISASRGLGSIRSGCPLSVCAPNPCKNGGRCNATDNVAIKCACREGWRGLRCEKKIITTRFQTPAFDGKSYITIPPSFLRLKRRRLELEVWFLTSTMNGLLVQLSGGADSHFLRVEVINGWLQASCRTSQGLFVIRSEDRIPIGEWVQLKIRKTRRFVIMTANEKLRSKMRIIPKSAKKLSKAERRRLSIFRVSKAPLYVGGAPNNPLNENSKRNDVWLKGGIQRVLVNRRRIDLYSPGVLRSPHIGVWRGPPCSPQQARCGPGRVCEAQLNSARCVCLQPPCPAEKAKAAGDGTGPEEGFVRDEAVQAINFNGYTLLRMKNRGHWKVRRSHEDNVVIKLKTSSRNGLVLLVTDTQRASPAESFFLLAVRNGFPEVAWNLGGPHCLIRIRGPHRISDNRWHELHALRNQGMSTLLVDGYPVSGQLNCTRTELRNDGWMWLGGYNSFIREFPFEYNHGFMGCIQHLIIDTEEMKLRDLAKPQRGEMKPCAVPFEF